MSPAGVEEMAAECAARLAKGGGARAGAGGSGELGAAAAAQLEAFVRELGGVSGSLASAAPSQRPSNGLSAAAGGIWATLAAERKDTDLLAAIKAQLELAQCSFRPNAAPASDTNTASIYRSVVASARTRLLR